METGTDLETPDLKALADSQALIVPVTARSRVSKARRLLGTLIRGPEFLALLTIVLVIFTWQLIIATDKLDEHTVSLTQAVAAESATISKEEEIVHQEAIDSPPQLDLVAQVTPPVSSVSGGEIAFKNQGSSYVSVAYAWCWGDDELSFDVNKAGYVQDPAILQSLLVHNSYSVPFAACSGKAGNGFAASRPGYIYTFTVYTTPSGLCRNREQWFALNASRSNYQSEEFLRSTFPSNLNQTARTRVLRTMNRATKKAWNMGINCLSASNTL